MIHIPADVPATVRTTFNKNYAAITNNSERIFLFTGDQKLEHLNNDFYGPGIDSADADPAHLFAIASQAPIGAFAAPLGLIAHYGTTCPNITYVAKLNGKTNLVPTAQRDPVSLQLWSVSDVITFSKNSGLTVAGIGYTIYLGSEYEAQMLQQAAQAVYQAHQHGLVAILWIYPRGAAITHETDGNLIAGAAGVAASLGADIVKLTAPTADTHHSSTEWLAIASKAAGKTKIICSGGPQKDAKEFLKTLYQQIYEGGTSGTATGRNIHQRSLKNALAFTDAIATLVCDNKTVDHAIKKLS